MKNSFKELKYDELVAKRSDLKKKYFDLRFQMVVGHVENPVEKRVLRRQLARIETLIHNADRAAAAEKAGANSAVTK